MPVYPTPGPAPKPASKRRRRNTPRSYGAAKPTTARAAGLGPRQLGIDNPHPLIAAIWDTVQHSCEAAFYSDSDWERLVLGAVVRESHDGQRSAVGVGMGGDPARAERTVVVAGGEASGWYRVEARAVDVDAVAADEQIARYKRVLKSV